ncbi:MAG TPA: hypothetical protein DCS07_12560 [Bdellovibrionales bacterium]|nr:MAG: hypothetical protein A2X97_08605 [Bdellovibrionales bacterium GWA1_52_35]HAR43442.1 hypothetical protein [Bdellovibrionales bacterium]HCM41644.1 hypothetical protein [Bdellovibrionales bacterium]
MTTEKHSEHFLTDARSFWWNKDYLELVSKRWETQNVTSVLDIGCGVGDWTAALLTILPEGTKVCAVDREPAWVQKTQDRFGHRVLVQQAAAEHLPFPNASFDLVTCQTLLIHVSDPKHVIKEMLRVLKPGGLLAVAEPSNAAQTRDSIYLSLNEASAIFEIGEISERGKIALVEGNNSLGDVLPGLFAECGLENIQTYTGDKAMTLVPPYSGPGQSEAIADRIRDADTNFFMFGYEQTKKYFLAGGGSQEDFERYWKIGLENLKKVKEAILNNTYHCAGGIVMYLISGRKGLI